MINLIDLDINQLTIDQNGYLDDVSCEKIDNFYDIIKDPLSDIDNIINEILLEIQSVSPSDIAFVKHRIKDVKALKDKISKIIRDKSDAGINNSNFLSLYDEIYDLVAGRIVFYFEPDRRLGFDFFHEDPRFSIDKITLYEALHSESKLNHPSLDTLIYRIQTSHVSRKDFKATIRSNGYESLHLTIRLESELILQSFDKKIIRKKKYLKHILDKIKVEIQIRSMLQDLWAQPEHGFNYEIKKSTTRENGSVYDSIFNTHKLLVKGVERFHSSIWDSYRYSNVPPLKNGSSSIAERLEGVNISNNYRELLIQLDKEMSDSSDPIAIFNELERIFDILDRDGSRSHRIWSLKFPRTIKEWEKQKILLLFLGYLVSIIGTDQIVSMVSKKIRQFYSRCSENRFDLSKQIYVLIKKGDAYFSGLNNHTRLDSYIDPLVSYRLSGVFLLDSPPNYARGKEELRLAVDRHDLEIESNSVLSPGDSIINSIHLHRRLAKFGWYLFLSKDQNIHHLDEASKNLKIALQSNDKPKDETIFVREKLKVIYDIITVEFFRLVIINHLTRNKSLDGRAEVDPVFENNAIRRFNLALNPFMDTISKEMPRIDSIDVLGKLNLTSHGFQALSIWLWANNDLQGARTAIINSRARLSNSEERPLVRDVIRQIEQFLVFKRILDI